MVIECPDCEFYVRENEEFCPDCGLISPGKKNSDDNDREFYKIQMPLFLGLTILAGLAGLYFHIHESLVISFLIAALPGAVISLSFSYLIAELTLRSRRKNQFSDSQKLLSVKESKLINTMFELDERENILTENLEKDKNNSHLLQLSVIIGLQQKLCDFQQNKIEIVRLENELLPYLGDAKALTPGQIRNGIREINNNLNILREMRQSIENFDARRILSERNLMLDSIKNSEIFFRRTRKKLEANKKTRGIRNTAKKITNSEEYKTVKTLDLYNSEPILPSIFEDLEKEYHLFSDKIYKDNDLLR